MPLEVYIKLLENPKMLQYLKQNTDWIKPLVRRKATYEQFEKFIKEKYQLRLSDKANELLDNIGLISTILETIK